MFWHTIRLIVPYIFESLKMDLGELITKIVLGQFDTFPRIEPRGFCLVVMTQASHA